MKIVDLDEKNVGLFCLCLEDWSNEAKEAGDKRKEWYEKKKKRGLRAKLALDEKGTIGGMIQYLPIEESFINGEGLFFIHCIWVHGHKQGRGDFRGNGMGISLLEAAEDDARKLGAKGIAAWGLALPFWMRASWFKKHGYKKADRQGMAVLLWKPFSKDVKKPKWLPINKKKPELTPGKVTVTSYVNGWCMAQNLAYERGKRAAVEIGDSVIFREIDTSDPKILRETGISDALFIDHKQVRTGPPPKYDKIKKEIKKRIRSNENC
jgi:GNAT superfamily N-acetyltransferase